MFSNFILILKYNFIRHFKNENITQAEKNTHVKKKQIYTHIYIYICVSDDTFVERGGEFVEPRESLRGRRRALAVHRAALLFADDDRSE